MNYVYESVVSNIGNSTYQDVANSFDYVGWKKIAQLDALNEGDQQITMIRDCLYNNLKQILK
jgi:hypothetical protein